MINCPNPDCKNANPEGSQSCRVCRAALPHHYLWGVGDLIDKMRPGTMVNQRYLLKRDRTFLDTKPGIVPESLPELPTFLQPYLHLSAYPLHVPRPYSVLRTPDQDYVVMLEHSALSMASHPDVPGMLPKLVNRWPDAPPLRQLSWLWQIAQIWDAFAVEQVAATLVDSELLRVDGSVVRLLSLSALPPSPEEPIASGQASGGRAQMAQPTLVDLARYWQPLAETAHASVRSFLARLCESLERSQLNAEQLSEKLSQAITVCGQGQGVTYDLAVFTDQGPTRKRNEDACFPDNGTHKSLTSEASREQLELLIVCDGIGGHQGGDVASKLAIATIQSQLQPLLSAAGDLSATDLSLAIEAAICAANDEISAQNDKAQRQARDRMGTTLVLALIKGSDIYIGHLGDSRAYRISSRGCQQVTLDDDVASRQVRLGGSLYREVLTQPGSGSLIQALGMGPSQSLRPTVQRFVLDESCVFLLCSDGLSDSDRVEQFWPSVLKPMVTAAVDAPVSAADVGKRLVSIANQYNGHDNVTVGVLNAQVVRASDRMVPRDPGVAGAAAGAAAVATTQAAATAQKGPRKKGSGRPITQLMDNDAGDLAETKSESPPRTASKTIQGSAPTAVTRSTQAMPEESPGRQGKGGLKKAGIVLLLLALAGVLAFVMIPGLNRPLGKLLPGGSEADPGELEEGPGVPGEQGSEPASEPLELASGSYLRILQSDPPSGRSVSTPSDEPSRTAEDVVPADTEDDAQGLLLYVNPEASELPNEIPGTVLTNTIVKVLTIRSEDPQSSWIQLQVCSLSFGDSVSDLPAETDAPGSSEAESLNVPEQTDGPQVLNPDSKGWISETELVANAELIQDLSSDQKGPCES